MYGHMYGIVLHMCQDERASTPLGPMPKIPISEFTECGINYIQSDFIYNSNFFKVNAKIISHF